jgi:hypothetical protein
MLIMKLARWPVRARVGAGREGPLLFWLTVADVDVTVCVDLRTQPHTPTRILILILTLTHAGARDRRHHLKPICADC